MSGAGKTATYGKTPSTIRVTKKDRKKYRIGVDFYHYKRNTVYMNNGANNMNKRDKQFEAHELSSLGWITILWVGEENFYFAYGAGLRGFCKAGA